MARKVKSAVTNVNTQDERPSTKLFSWPDLPMDDMRALPLELRSVLDSQIITIDAFFPRKTCSTWLEWLANSGHVKLSASPAAKRGEARRTNHRFSIQDAVFAERLWQDTGLQRLLHDAKNMEDFASSERAGSVPVGLNPNIRVGRSHQHGERQLTLRAYFQIYRYEPGQSFAPHYDESVKLGQNYTEWTLLIYISGDNDVVGGETAFYPSGLPPCASEKDEIKRTKRLKPGYEDVLVPPAQGMALLHRHGRECLIHEGKPVLKGTKWVLRSDVVFGLAA